MKNKWNNERWLTYLDKDHENEKRFRAAEKIIGNLNTLEGRGSHPFFTSDVPYNITSLPLSRKFLQFPLPKGDPVYEKLLKAYRWIANIMPYSSGLDPITLSRALRIFEQETLFPFLNREMNQYKYENLAREKGVSPGTLAGSALSRAEYLVNPPAIPEVYAEVGYQYR